MFNRKLKAEVKLLREEIERLSKSFNNYRSFIAQKMDSDLPNLISEYEKFTGNAIRHEGYDQFSVMRKNIGDYPYSYAHTLSYTQLKCDINKYKAAELDKLKKGEV
jgi:hypothetical protein